MMASSGELAIARSVIYASLFDYPLTLQQVHQTLLESEQTTQEILAIYASSKMLQAIVEYREGFFFPRGRGDLLTERCLREARSCAFLARHRRLLAFVCALPYVRMVALSGSIAHLNLEGDGDLDLFIVTRGRRVWSVTVAVLILARLMRQRRIVCANFVIADSQLALEQQDLFTANQVIHLRPLVGASLFKELLSANPFVARFYPNFERSEPGASPFQLDLTQHPAPGTLLRLKTALEAVLSRPSLIVELACRHAYGSYLRRRAGSWPSPEQVRLRADCLKLHTRSHRRSILDRFERAVREAIERAEQTTPSAVGSRS
jgi:hypothetical protein